MQPVPLDLNPSPWPLSDCMTKRSQPVNKGGAFNRTSGRPNGGLDLEDEEWLVRDEGDGEFVCIH